MKILRLILCATIVVAVASCAGEEGKTGSVGVSNYEIVLAPCTILPDAPAHGFQDVICPGTKRVLGGGVTAFSDATCESPSGEASVTFNGLLVNAPGTWVGDMVRTSGLATYMQTQVICANVD